jgi:hypothetical protein
MTSSALPAVFPQLVGPFRRAKIGEDLQRSADALRTVGQASEPSRSPGPQTQSWGPSKTSRGILPALPAAALPLARERPGFAAICYRGYNRSWGGALFPPARNDLGIQPVSGGNEVWAQRCEVEPCAAFPAFGEALFC